MAKHLAVFVENRPGKLEKITRALLEANINIRAISIQDRGDFGVVKLLVDKPQSAEQALKSAGFVCALREIIAVEMEDKPGGLHKIAEIFSKNNINILDAYGFVIESSKIAVLCVEVEKVLGLDEILQKEGLKIISDHDLYGL
ncbi:MAG TPA: ACT domain-containing protein [Candidatus Omnitrophica bacterium]|nr:ACT domain-containing protein [Candidatus Omnitrophota bacterium]